MKARIGFVTIQVSLIGAICSVCAGIIVTDFSARGTGIGEARFLADLQTIRCQLELYKIQHDEQLPPTESYAGFERALTTKGADNSGPYFQMMPANPFNGDSTVRFENNQNTAGTGLSYYIERFYVGAEAHQLAGVYVESGWDRWGSDERDDSTSELLLSGGPKIGYQIGDNWSIEGTVQFGRATSFGVQARYKF
jgi:hypothetical protein